MKTPLVDPSSWGFRPTHWPSRKCRRSRPQASQRKLQSQLFDLYAGGRERRAPLLLSAGSIEEDGISEHLARRARPILPPLACPETETTKSAEQANGKRELTSKEGVRACCGALCVRTMRCTNSTASVSERGSATVASGAPTSPSRVDPASRQPSFL